MRRAKGEPKSATRYAMRTQAQENRAFLGEIALRITFQEFRETCKMQDFESALYLVLSDRYEVTPEEERVRMCRGVDPEVIRASDLYKLLYERVGQEADEVVKLQTEKPEEWIQRAGGYARRRIAREIVGGTKMRYVLGASREVMDREMPKQTRVQSDAKTIIMFSPDAAASLQKAFAVVDQKQLPEAIDITPK